MTRTPFAIAATLALLLSGSPAPSHAEDAIEAAGVAVGVGPGNLLFLPIKAISVVTGALTGALSYVVTGGNLELTRQIWEDTALGPYLITPQLAREAIGERPELYQPKKDGMPR
jgi:hypothetical protein